MPGAPLHPLSRHLPGEPGEVRERARRNQEARHSRYRTNTRGTLADLRSGPAATVEPAQTILELADGLGRVAEEQEKTRRIEKHQHAHKKQGRRKEEATYKEYCDVHRSNNTVTSFTSSPAAGANPRRTRGLQFRLKPVNILSECHELADRSSWQWRA
jgi:hypothetical protein